MKWKFSEFVVYFMHRRRCSRLKTWTQTIAFKLVTTLCQTIESC